MAAQRAKDPSAGYAQDFVDVVRSLAPLWKAGSKCKLIANAGGLNPQSCAAACAQVLRDAGVSGMRIGVVWGDDVLPHLSSRADEVQFNNLDTGESLATVRDRLVTANAYVGGAPIVDALRQGADIVITGRVADPCLIAGPAVFHYGWSWDDYDRIASALVAGHLIECGTQVTGGISTNWLDVPDAGNMGFPVIELDADGTIVVTKPAATGGWVNERTVKEQLTYEIGDPGDYLTPDARVSLLSIQVAELGGDRVRVRGVKGNAPTEFYKVSATYRDGYWAQGMLTVFGRDAVKKARRSGEIIIERLRRAGVELQEHNIECLGAGACGPGVIAEPDLLECVLRIAVRDPRKEAVERFSKELAPLVTSGPQGITGYAAGRPRVSPVFGYWPCLIEKSEVNCVVDVVEV